MCHPNIFGQLKNDMESLKSIHIELNVFEIYVFSTDFVHHNKADPIDNTNYTDILNILTPLSLVFEWS